MPRVYIGRRGKKVCQTGARGGKITGVKVASSLSKKTRTPEKVIRGVSKTQESTIVGEEIHSHDRAWWEERPGPSDNVPENGVSKVAVFPVG